METNIDCKEECKMTHRDDNKCDGQCPSAIWREIEKQLNNE